MNTGFTFTRILNLPLRILLCSLGASWEKWRGDLEEVKMAHTKAMKAIEEAEFKSTLNQPEDELPAILLIKFRSGRNWKVRTGHKCSPVCTGCTDKNRIPTCTELDWQDGDGAGIKTCTLPVQQAILFSAPSKQKAAYTAWCGYLIFDSNARRHTSFASVLCLSAD